MEVALLKATGPQDLSLSPPMGGLEGGHVDFCIMAISSRAGHLQVATQHGDANCILTAFPPPSVNIMQENNLRFLGTWPPES